MAARSRTRPSTGADSRASAALAVHRICDQGQSLTRVFHAVHLPEAALDRALTQELVYGVLRTRPRLDALASLLLHRPLPRRDRDLHALILVGLYQLTSTKIPAHAAVAATVEAARQLGKADKAGLVNALLRRFLREREDLLEQVDQQPQVRWPVPVWLLEALRDAWPEHWEEIIRASDSHPPLTLRVNRMRIARTDYLEQLGTANLEARALEDCESGVQLSQPCPAHTLPGFAEGLVSVQDQGAQHAAELLDARPGQRVLDACAAPGGKTAHILERAGDDLDLVALDADAERLATVGDTLGRLGLHARLEHADAAHPAGDWTQPLFDRILLDAPCSATGVIRRHPDIKWLRQASDIPSLCAQQAAILDAVWPLLAPGGRLLYATCSLLPDENERQIGAFLARQPQAREIPITVDWGLARPHGRQMFPQAEGNDGFYYALIEKPAS